MGTGPAIKKPRKRGIVPSRGLLAAGWVLFVIDMLRADITGAGWFFALFLVAAGTLLVALAAQPYRPGTRRPARPPAGSRGACVFIVLCGIGLVVATAITLPKRWDTLWADNSSLLLGPTGVVLILGGAFRYRRLASLYWSRGEIPPFTPPAQWSRRRRAGLLAVAAGVAVLAAGTTLYVGLTEDDASTAKAVATQPVPAHIARIGWRVPVSGNIQTLATGAAGPLVVTYDGVTAYNGTTGQELWHYRRPNGASVAVSPDRRTVVVRDEAEVAREFTRYVVLDSATGTRRSQFDVTDPDVQTSYSSDDRTLLAGNDVIVHRGIIKVTDSDGDVHGTPVLRGLSMDGGKQRWQLAPDAGSNDDQDCGTFSPRIAGRALVRLGSCTQLTGSDRSTAYTMSGIDVSTGRPIWTKTFGAASRDDLVDATRPQLQVAPDGSSVYAALQLHERNVKRQPGQAWIVDPATGKELLHQTATVTGLSEPVLLSGQRWIAPSASATRNGHVLDQALYQPGAAETRSTGEQLGWGTVVTELPAGPPTNEGQPTWNLIGQQLISYTFRDGADGLPSGIGGSDPPSRDDLASYGYSPASLSLRDLTPGATASRLRLSDDLMVRVDRIYGFGPQVLVAAPGAVAVLLENGEDGADTLIGLQ